jgi:hypothetical protein
MRIKVVEKANSHGREAYWCSKCRLGFYVTYDDMPLDELNKLEAEWKAKYPTV